VFFLIVFRPDSKDDPEQVLGYESSGLTSTKSIYVIKIKSKNDIILRKNKIKENNQWILTGFSWVNQDISQPGFLTILHRINSPLISFET